jgi:hypothetical protein
MKKDQKTNWIVFMVDKCGWMVREPRLKRSKAPIECLSPVIPEVVQSSKGGSYHLEILAKPPPATNTSFCVEYELFFESGVKVPPGNQMTTKKAKKPKKDVHTENAESEGYIRWYQTVLFNITSYANKHSRFYLVITLSYPTTKVPFCTLISKTFLIKAYVAQKKKKKKRKRPSDPEGFTKQPPKKFKARLVDSSCLVSSTAAAAQPPVPPLFTQRQKRVTESVALSIIRRDPDPNAQYTVTIPPFDEVLNPGKDPNYCDVASLINFDEFDFDFDLL